MVSMVTSPYDSRNTGVYKDDEGRVFFHTKLFGEDTFDTFMYNINDANVPEGLKVSKETIEEVKKIEAKNPYPGMEAVLSDKGAIFAVDRNRMEELGDPDKGIDFVRKVVNGSGGKKEQSAVKTLCDMGAVFILSDKNEKEKLVELYTDKYAHLVYDNRRHDMVEVAKETMGITVDDTLDKRSGEARAYVEIETKIGRMGFAAEMAIKEIIKEGAEGGDRVQLVKEYEDLTKMLDTFHIKPEEAVANFAKLKEMVDPKAEKIAEGVEGLNYKDAEFSTVNKDGDIVKFTNNYKTQITVDDTPKAEELKIKIKEFMVDENTLKSTENLFKIIDRENPKDMFEAPIEDLDTTKIDTQNFYRREIDYAKGEDEQTYEETHRLFDEAAMVTDIDPKDYEDVDIKEDIPLEPPKVDNTPKERPKVDNSESSNNSSRVDNSPKVDNSERPKMDNSPKEDVSKEKGEPVRKTISSDDHGRRHRVFKDDDKGKKEDSPWNEKHWSTRNKAIYYAGLAGIMVFGPVGAALMITAAILHHKDIKNGKIDNDDNNKVERKVPEPPDKFKTADEIVSDKGTDRDIDKGANKEVEKGTEKTDTPNIGYTTEKWGTEQPEAKTGSFKESISNAIENVKGAITGILNKIIPGFKKEDDVEASPKVVIDARDMQTEKEKQYMALAAGVSDEVGEKVNAITLAHVDKFCTEGDIGKISERINEGLEKGEYVDENHARAAFEDKINNLDTDNATRDAAMGEFDTEHEIPPETFVEVSDAVYDAEGVTFTLDADTPLARAIEETADINYNDTPTIEAAEASDIEEFAKDALDVWGATTSEFDTAPFEARPEDYDGDDDYVIRGVGKSENPPDDPPTKDETEQATNEADKAKEISLDKDDKEMKFEASQGFINNEESYDVPEEFTQEQQTAADNLLEPNGNQEQPLDDSDERWDSIAKEFDGFND